MKRKKGVFVLLSEKNHLMLQNGEVVYKRVTVPSLTNNLLQIVTERSIELSNLDDALDSQLEKLHKENPDFSISPILLKQYTVDMIILENYCWVAELTEFKVFILSEKSHALYKKQGMNALKLLDDNVTIPVEGNHNKKDENAEKKVPIVSKEISK